MKQEELDTLAAQLRRSITRLNRRLRHSSLGDTSPAQASMLATIEQLQRPNLGDLAQAEQIQPPSVTRLVQSLTERGFLVRTTDEIDRRSQRVELTASGRKELARIRKRKTEWLSGRLESLSSEQLAQLPELASLLEAILGDK